MRRIGTFTGLILMLILAACAPPAPQQATPTATATQTLIASPVEKDTDPTPLATSRGDKLEASDPATVKIGDGRPTLIEFFRFT
jgi:hypothetical protein